MTSLNLPGFSITLLLLPREPLTTPASTSSSRLSLDTALLLDLFDAPTEAPAWKWTYKGEPEMRVVKEGEVEKVGKRDEKAGEEVKGPKRESFLRSVCLSPALRTQCLFGAGTSRGGRQR